MCSMIGLRYISSYVIIDEDVSRKKDMYTSLEYEYVERGGQGHISKMRLIVIIGGRIISGSANI